ncbi:MAG: M20 family peptidase, partial [Halobacteria archaeon]|nr:M20 family peptidase [Halobacteria archaeon]
MNKEINTKVLEEHQDELVNLALDLIGFDTQNPPGHTHEAVEYIRNYFSDLGIETETITFDDKKPNLMATLPGRSSYTLLYNGHLDTVPYDAEDWEHDPLGERAGERIYG